MDAFFPYVEEIENEIVAAEYTVFHDSDDYGDRPPPLARTSTRPPDKLLEKSDTFRSGVTVDEKISSVKGAAMSTKTATTRFAMPRPTFAISYRRWRRSAHRMFSKLFPEAVPTPDLSVSPTMVTLRRMARTRRLVTTLSRVLVAKSEVVTRLQKRLGDSIQAFGGREDEDLVIYMGDVRGMSPLILIRAVLLSSEICSDHIITLQQSLAHYERMLSQSHPSYLQNLRVTASGGRSNTDKAVLMLTTVSFAVVPAQIIIGRTLRYLLRFSLTDRLQHDE